MTCSDDATLRVWSISERRQTGYIDLNSDNKGKPLPADPKTKELSHAAKARSLDASPDGKFLVVGFRDGSFRIYQTKDFKYVAHKKIRKSWVSDIKFSPDGSQFAVGSHDRVIDVYQLHGVKKLFSLAKHSSYITHLDWSRDGLTMHSNCGAYELLYWDLKTGQQDPSGASNYCDEEWNTWTCVLGWPVQGKLK